MLLKLFECWQLNQSIIIGQPDNDRWKETERESCNCNFTLKKLKFTRTNYFTESEYWDTRQIPSTEWLPGTAVVDPSFLWSSPLACCMYIVVACYLGGSSILNPIQVSRVSQSPVLYLINYMYMVNYMYLVCNWFTHSFFHSHIYSLIPYDDCYSVHIILH